MNPKVRFHPGDPVVGIVAEYNPFHLGHAHHLERARALSHTRYAIVTLSSCFVQRGEPALLDKEVRTRMALAAGVDVVLELPAAFSCANAGVFANAAVDILAATGVVTHLSFGAEDAARQCEIGTRAAAILNDEPIAFKERLRAFLADGNSYAQARSDAIEELVSGGGAHLANPNNTLAVAYTQRVLACRYDLTLVPVQRLGAGYRDESTETAAGGAEKFASATAIRKKLAQGDFDFALRQTPEKNGPLLLEAVRSGRAVLDDAPLWRALRALLLRESPQSLAKIAQIREGFEHRMIRSAWECDTFAEAVNHCTSRRYPQSRVRRAFIHALTGLCDADFQAVQRLGPPYIRVLGASEAGLELLKAMRKTARLPLVSRQTTPKGQNGYAQTILDYEKKSGAIWETLVPSSDVGRDGRFRTITPKTRESGESARACGETPPEVPSPEWPRRTKTLP